MYGSQGMRGPTGESSGKVGGYNVGRLQNFTPEQQQLFSSLFSHVSPGSYLSRLAGGDEAAFAEQEAPALRQFGQLQGNIASRFSGMGAGARRSSGFGHSINQAASSFAQDLQSRRQALQRQALMDLLGISGELLGQRPEEQFLMRPNQKRSFGEQIIGTGLPIAGSAIGAYFGGPAGAKIGGSIGSAASQAFLS